MVVLDPQLRSHVLLKDNDVQVRRYLNFKTVFSLLIQKN